MSTMSIKEALEKVLKDMKAMSAEQLRSEIIEHKNGEFAKALRSAQSFLTEQYSIYSYPIAHFQSLIEGEPEFFSKIASIECIENLLAANDSQFMLAA